MFDLVVIGGGITGAGVLKEAAERGLTALLIETAFAAAKPRGLKRNAPKGKT